MVGGVTSPVLKTVGGVTEDLPIVGGSGEGGNQQAASQNMSAEEVKMKKKKALAMKKKQLALEMEEAELESD